MCAGVRHESGRRGDTSAKGLAPERRWYARLAALLWGSLVSCGRLSIGQLPRLQRTAAVDGAPSGSRAGCQPAPHHASDSTLMSCTLFPPAKGAVPDEFRGRFRWASLLQNSQDAWPRNAQAVDVQPGRCPEVLLYQIGRAHV